MKIFKKKSKPAKVNTAASVFFRTASAAEKKRVFKEVIEESIEMQQETIRKADEIIRRREAEQKK